MSHVRERYNARARRSTAGGTRKKGKQKLGHTEASQSEVQTQDANALIHQSKSKEEKERDKREKLRSELVAQSESKWNTKKRKRMDQYIDKKLKNEERVVLFEKLAQSQAELPSSLLLQSSSTLGTGRSSTHQARQDREEDKEVRRALDGKTGKRRRRNDDTFVVVQADGEGSTEGSGDEESELEAWGSTAHLKSGGGSRDDPISIVGVIDDARPTEKGVGSALKMNPDGTRVAPTIHKKAKTKGAFSQWARRRGGTTPVVPVESDTSFDSSDSGNDPLEEDHRDDDGDEREDGREVESGGSTHDSDAAEDAEAPPSDPPRKRGGFKEWALNQIHHAKGYDVPTPTPIKSVDPPIVNPENSTPSAQKQKIQSPDGYPRMRGPLGRDVTLPNTAFALKLMQDPSLNLRTKAVSVERPIDVQESRLLLPVVSEEQPIMEAILYNPVVIICGETGSGKTTQIPQFLYEAGFATLGGENPGMIGITQPRRVAAVSMATRVAHELSLSKSLVSYQIRYDTTISPNTCIKFMTDGVLLRELATDFLLTKYSVIIIDEAHERSVNTDILIGVLSRVIKLREDMWKDGKEGAKPLRLIIMSATLRVADFSENKALFPSPPPVIDVAARQHPVTIHFNRRTASDYVTEAVKKTIKIHTRLPPGGILIFLTGQNEIMGACRKLEARFGKEAIARKRGNRAPLKPESTQERPTDKRLAASQADLEAEDLDFGDADSEHVAPDVDDGMVDEDPEALDSDDDDDTTLNKELGLGDDDSMDAPMHIVPLYSLLPSEQQMKVFEPPPPGSRLVIVSTNVAETSLTIPGIRYVVDCGRAKERHYNTANAVQSFQIDWISKASAAQRAGRAGRTGPGHCYRLYSSALYEHHFDQFTQPEIRRLPIEGVVLLMKSMHIDVVVNFPFPTPPDGLSLSKAETMLSHLGALTSSPSLKCGVEVKQITELGRTMSLFPLAPRFSRMLVSGQQHGCLPYIIAIIAALSVGDPFIHEETVDQEKRADDDDQSEAEDPSLAHLTSSAQRLKEARRLRRKAYFNAHNTHSSLGNGVSDVFKVLSVVGAYEYAGGTRAFCEENFVRVKAMEEIHKLRAQISHIVQTHFSGIDAGFVPKLQPPSALQLKVLRQLLTAGFIDQVAVRKDRVEQSAASGTQYANAKGVAYRALGVKQDVFLHPSSVLFNSPPPEYLVFHEVVQTSQTWLKGLTTVNPAWLSSLAKPPLCIMSKPVKAGTGTFVVVPRFGPDGWELPPIKSQ